MDENNEEEKELERFLPAWFLDIKGDIVKRKK